MSSTQDRPQVQVQRDRGPSTEGWVRLIIAAVIVVLILLFIFQNTAQVKFKFLFFDFTWPAWAMLLVAMIIGFLAGLVVSALLRRRKKRELRRRAMAE